MLKTLPQTAQAVAFDSYDDIKDSRETAMLPGRLTRPPYPFTPDPAFPVVTVSHLWPSHQFPTARESQTAGKTPGTDPEAATPLATGGGSTRPLTSTSQLYVVFPVYLLSMLYLYEI